MATYANGTLLQVSGTTPIYFLLDGQLSQVPDTTTLSNLFGSSPTITTVSQSTLNALPMGPPLTSGACIAGTGAPGSQQWLLTWGQRLWITAAVLPSYQFYEPNLQNASALVLAAFPQGVTLD
jgi:hypothetical protein